MDKERLDNIETDFHIIDEEIRTTKILDFSGAKIHLDTGEVELKKDVSEAAKEFWEEVGKAFPLG